MPYRQAVASSGKPARKAGKRVWEVDIYVRGEYLNKKSASVVEIKQTIVKKL